MSIFHTPIFYILVVLPLNQALPWAPQSDDGSLANQLIRQYLAHRQYRSQYRTALDEPREVYRDVPKSLNEERTSFSGVWAPEDLQIDAINNEERSSQDEIKNPLTKPTSQQESAPDVYQQLPEKDVKQQRIPQPAADGPRSDATQTRKEPSNDVYFIALVAGCSGAAVFGVVAAGFCWYKLQKNAKAAAEAEYPAYGVTGPSKDHPSPPSGDRKLAQSAQMYHYQHQKQQMIAIEKANSDRHVSTSDLDSEEENEEGDYTVYECPGLAPTGEMEVKNPLFQDEPTPASPPVSAKEPEK